MPTCLYGHSKEMLTAMDAVRKVKSRFGGAFTWMLICLMVVLVTNSILERGHTITSTDSAERTTMLQDLVAKAEASGETGFGTLRVELEAFAVLSQAELDKKCQQITLLNATQSSSLYTCSITKVMASTCNVTLNCETTFNLSLGIVHYLFTLVSPFI